MRLKTGNIEDSQEHKLTTIRAFCVQLTLITDLILINMRRNKNLI